MPLWPTEAEAEGHGPLDTLIRFLAPDEAPAEATSPYGTGINIGSQNFLCRWDPLFPLVNCASEAYAQGLTNAGPSPLYIKIGAGARRWFYPGSVTPTGIIATGATGPSTRPLPEPNFITRWGWPLGIGALAVAGGLIWRSRRKRRRRR